MPRPGPRPYECMRRAWHCERHQPIRGSLIQEIFRVVTEIHSSATKMNKEWQEKLPIVVLKAEAIMYSRADSEAEYTDLNTLWDRANDAINTIIRRGDSAETGDLLQPCIEAALNLGCIPRKASRSQRNNDQRCYLSPNPQEPSPSCPSNSISGPHCVAVYSDVDKQAALSPPDAVLDIAINRIPFQFQPQTDSSQSIAPKIYNGLIHGHSVYPLCYWSCNLRNDPQLCCKSSITKTSAGTTNKSHPMCDMGIPNKPELARIQETPQTATRINCDLSLRLGPCRGSEDIYDQSHHREFQNSKTKNPKSQEPHFFPNKEEDAAKVLNMDGSIKKRKALALTLTPYSNDGKFRLAKINSFQLS